MQYNTTKIKDTNPTKQGKTYKHYKNKAYYKNIY